MKKVHIIVSYLFLTVLIILGHITLAQQTATFYLITVIDDGTCAELTGTEIDRENLTTFSRDVAKVTNRELISISLKTSEFSFDKLETQLSKLKCDEQTVIFFAYSGMGSNHGGNYPSFVANKVSINLEKVANLLETTKAGFKITFYDTSNESSACSPVNDTINSQNMYDYSKLLQASNNSIEANQLSGNTVKNTTYSDLFNFKGTLKICSAMKGQQSFGSNKGGFFVDSFIQAIQSTTNWQVVLKNATLLTLSKMKKLDSSGHYDYNLINGVFQQIPYYEIITPRKINE